MQASFTQLYSITINQAAGGSALASATAAKSSETVTIQASPSNGNIFGQWTATGITLTNAQKIANPLTISMPAADITLTPSYLSAEVIVGDVIWAVTNSIPNLGGTATFKSTPYFYDGPTQITWTQATGGVAGATVRGVCPPGWRLPSKAEYEALIANSTSVWEAVSGVAGRTFTIRGNGQKLFFAASGYYNGQYSGSNGSFWSSTTSDGAYSYIINFGSTGSVSMITQGSALPVSIRCVVSAN